MVAAEMKIIMVMDEIQKVIELIFANKKHLRIFVTSLAILFLLMFFIPVNAIPGNKLGIQAVIFGYKDYLFFGTLSFLSSLVLTMQVIVFRQRRSRIASNATLGGVGIFSGVISSVFGTATCGLCVSVLFGFLGIGTVLFLVEHKIYITLVSFGLLLTSLYFSSKAINNDCGCHV